MLLVDTYDTLQGVRKVVDLARELGDAFKVRAVRLDSGDLVTLSQEARKLLDAAGLTSVGVFASGGLNEDEIAEIVAAGAPIEGFGVGTDLAVSADAPALDIAYKLTEYSGTGRMKLSTGKRSLPGRKQVFRQSQDGVTLRDVIGRHGEALPGEPLLRQVMKRRRAHVAAGADRADPGALPGRDRASSRRTACVGAYSASLQCGNQPGAA